MLLRGRLFAGALFAGALFGAPDVPAVVVPPAAQNTGSAGGGGGFQRQTGKINREHRLLEIERALEKTDEQDLTDILSMIAKTWVH